MSTFAFSLRAPAQLGATPVSSRHRPADRGRPLDSGCCIIHVLDAGLKLDPVTGIDIDPMFRDAAVKSFPDIRALCGDAFALTEGKWDIVLSSHTIEHVDDPADFLKRMEERASRYVVVACPTKRKI